ncbi:hypothetical protein Tco_0792513 [Tanacetum coccineum]
MARQYTDHVAQRLELIDPDQVAQEDLICGLNAWKVNVCGVLPRSLMTSCFGKWLDLAYFDHEPHMIDYMLQRQCYANDAHYDMPLIFYVHGRGLHFGHREFSLITCLHFEELDHEFADTLMRLVENLEAWNAFPWDLDIDEDVDEFKMKLEDEEMLLFKEENILEEESRLRLEEETRLMREEE